MTERLKTWGSSHQVTPRIKFKKTQKESKWVCLRLKERQSLEARNRETIQQFGFKMLGNWVATKPLIWKHQEEQSSITKKQSCYTHTYIIFIYICVCIYLSYEEPQQRRRRRVNEQPIYTATLKL